MYYFSVLSESLENVNDGTVTVRNYILEERTSPGSSETSFVFSIRLMI